MNWFMIKKLVSKDIDLFKIYLVGYALLAIVSVAIALIGGSATFYLGSVLLCTALIVAGIHPIFTLVIGEHKSQMFAFVMSLPISNVDYTVAKIISVLCVCFVPWVTAILLVNGLILISPDIPDGLVLVAMLLATEIMAGHFILLAMALITRSEAACICTFVSINIFTNFFIFGSLRSEAVQETLKSTTVVWSAPVLTALAIEVGIIFMAVMVVFVTQSRRKDLM